MSVSIGSVHTDIITHPGLILVMGAGVRVRGTAESMAGTMTLHPKRESTVEISHINALARAENYRRIRRDNIGFEKSDAVRELAAFSLFTASELAALLGVSVGFVQNVAGDGLPESARHWKLSALDALWHIAWGYKNGGDIEFLVTSTVRAGNSIRAVSELTGVPKDTIREIMYDHQNGMGILRARANSPRV